MIETTCQACGSSVTPQFVRVFAEDEAEGVYTCPACTGEAAIISGAYRPNPSPSAASGESGAPDVAADGGGERQ